jgi:hypothetical protein
MVLENRETEKKIGNTLSQSKPIHWLELDKEK